MTYYAMTSTYPRRREWLIVGVGNTADEAQTDAEQRLGTMGDAVRNHDIYAETALKNLTVKSASAAVREGFVSRDFDPLDHPAWQKVEG